MGHPTIPPAVRLRIAEQRRSGKTYEDIANEENVSVESVRRIVKEAGIVPERMRPREKEPVAKAVERLQGEVEALHDRLDKLVAYVASKK